MFDPIPRYAQIYNANLRLKRESSVLRSKSMLVKISNSGISIADIVFGLSGIKNKVINGFVSSGITATINRFIQYAIVSV